MKKIILMAGLAIGISTVLWSCKSDKLIQPHVPEHSKNLDSPDPLISYLAHLTKTNVNDIVFDADANEYVINNKIKITKAQIASSYKNANEYKLNNGIPKSN